MIDKKDMPSYIEIDWDLSPFCLLLKDGGKLKYKGAKKEAEKIIREMVKSNKKAKKEMNKLGVKL